MLEKDVNFSKVLLERPSIFQCNIQIPLSSLDRIQTASGLLLLGLSKKFSNRLKYFNLLSYKQTLFLNKMVSQNDIFKGFFASRSLADSNTQFVKCKRLAFFVYEVTSNP